MADQTLYSVGVGDFIAYENGRLVAMGKFDTETNMEFTASYLDIRAGKRGKLVARYAHSSNATFSIVAANYVPEIYQASMGGQLDPNNGCVPMEESCVVTNREFKVSHPVISRGDIGALVWVKYKGEIYGGLSLKKQTTDTVVIPTSNSDGSNWANIPDNAEVCAIYMYRNAAAKTFTMPAEVNPAIWHIWVDIDLVADKSGSGKVGRQVIEIPLAQLSPEQTINATMDGYSNTRVTGVMLADKSNANACGGQGVYAYITTEIFDKNWYDDVFALTNDPDDLTIGTSSTATLKLIGLENNDNFVFITPSQYTVNAPAGQTTGYITFVASFTPASGDAGTETTFADATGIITTGTAAGTMTITATVVGTTIPVYTIEVQVVKPAS